MPKGGFGSYLIPFLTGGGIVAGVKFVTQELNDPKLAAMLGGFPLGLFSIYFLREGVGKAYGLDYLVITSILLTSVIVFNILVDKFKWEKNTALVASLAVWFGLAGLRYVGMLPHF